MCIFVLYVVVSPAARMVLNDEPIKDLATTTDATVATTTEPTPIVSEPPVAEPTPTPMPTPVSVPTPKPIPAPSPKPEPATGTYTKADVALHSSDGSCWSIINGNVYDLTAYIPKHPGGPSKIRHICGENGTSAFEGQHGGESKPENTLAKYWIGILAN
jgi:hypothetical protein